MVITSLLQQSAVNVIGMFSNRIVTDINVDLPVDQ
jgi:hypothetical protein